MSVRMRPSSPTRCAPLRALALAGAALLSVAHVPAAAQTGSSGPSVVATLQRDVEEVRAKLVSLARAIPASDWGWRPAPGVRSVEEVVRHVAYDGYYLPTAAGVAAPDATGITRAYDTALAWGTRPFSRERLLEELDASLAHLSAAMATAGDPTLGEPVTVFGREMDRQGLWLLATVHLHEHLGQLIAYARVLGVVPPWSVGG